MLELFTGIKLNLVIDAMEAQTETFELRSYEADAFEDYYANGATAGDRFVAACKVALSIARNPFRIGDLYKAQSCVEAGLRENAYFYSGENLIGELTASDPVAVSDIAKEKMRGFVGNMGTVFGMSLISFLGVSLSGECVDTSRVQELAVMLSETLCFCSGSVLLLYIAREPSSCIR